MTQSADIRAIQACLNNDLGPLSAKFICGVVGDSPSHYSKSPPIWNAVFKQLGLDCAYVPMDVSEERLPALFAALRNSQRVLGVNVTVPHKSAVMNLLDNVEQVAECIGAVNTVVRTPDGKLAGTNTDGQGFLESIFKPSTAGEQPPVKSLRGAHVMIIGAGGSGRAVAFSLVEPLETGGLYICNRTLDTARDLSEELKSRLPNVAAVAETELEHWAPRCALIINCSLKGQGGIRTVAPGKVGILEAYSALAPANPATFPDTAAKETDFYRDWLAASLADIEANHRVSLRLALSVPQETVFCDLIYFPVETVFLRHARLSGHRTLNGKGMIIAQAVEGFFKICAPLLGPLGAAEQERRTTVSGIMRRAW